MKSLVSPNGRKAGLLKDQLQLVKRKEHNRYEILPIEESLSFEKGLFIFVRAPLIIISVLIHYLLYL